MKRDNLHQVTSSHKRPKVNTFKLIFGLAYDMVAYSPISLAFRVAVKGVQ